MKPLYIILGVTLCLASAFVIPDEEVLADLNREGSSPLKHHLCFSTYALTPNLKTTSTKPPKPKPTKPPKRKTPCFLNIYEELTRCRSTTKFASPIKQDKTLVNILNTVSLAHTVFAPTDQAFDEFPGNLSAFSKEDISALALYHVSPGLVSLDGLLESGGGTVPTLLNQSVLGGDGLAQRVDFRVDVEGEGEVVLGYKGDGRVLEGDIPATNGLLHLITSLLLPPPPTVAILDSLPTEFSTFTLALIKTGLYNTLASPIANQPPNKSTASNTTSKITLFAPPNTAFESLPSSIPEFLFSTEEGTKYLRALLEYHIVVNYTLFSDVLYTDKGEVVEFKPGEGVRFELPTLLGGGNCSVVVDIGDGEGKGYPDGDEDGEIATKITPGKIEGMVAVNGVEVTSMDSVTRYGVMHVIDRILIPGGWDEDEDGELIVKKLKERLNPWVEYGDKTRSAWDVDHPEL